MRQPPTWSDGCTAFPEGPWSPCCWAHDAAYRKGGGFWDRLLADVKLAHCAAKKGYPQIATLLFIGVRLGGWWPWLAHKAKARAQRKMLEHAKILKMLRQRKIVEFRKFRGGT